jgi:comEA protein
MTIFTPQERRVVTFLLVSLLVGSAVKLYRSRRAFQSGPTPTGIAEHLSVRDSASVVELDTLIEEVADMIKGNVRPIREKVLDINTASESELCLLPGIGPSIAQRIVHYREVHGKFRSVKDLVDVRGIGEKRLSALEKLVFVSGGLDEDEDASEARR